jgi:hypothetical protein
MMQEPRPLTQNNEDVTRSLSCRFAARARAVNCSVCTVHGGHTDVAVLSLHCDRLSTAVKQAPKLEAPYKYQVTRLPKYLVSITGSSLCCGAPQSFVVVLIA